MNFSKEFFEEEMRDGFQVSRMMKRAWAAELEVMEVVINICERHGLHCFATGGTLLGAVRHGGFIPWDDDLDVALMRDEYMELLQYLPAELPEGFVVAGTYADSLRLQRASNVPHLRVIADEEYWNMASYMTRFHGFPYFRIGIDIFPWDFLSKDADETEEQLKICHMIMFTVQNWELYVQDQLLESRICEIENLCHKHIDRDQDMIRQLWLIYDEVAGRVQREESAGQVYNTQFFTEAVRPYSAIPLEYYSEFIKLPFEQTYVWVPKEYKKALTCLFGKDYMKPVKYTAEHEYPFYLVQQDALQQIFDEEDMTVSIDEFCYNWQKAIGEI